jgi:hypothetical protein
VRGRLLRLRAGRILAIARQQLVFWSHAAGCRASGGRHACGWGGVGRRNGQADRVRRIGVSIFFSR